MKANSVFFVLLMLFSIHSFAESGQSNGNDPVNFESQQLATQAFRGIKTDVRMSLSAVIEQRLRLIKNGFIYSPNAPERCSARLSADPLARTLTFEWVHNPVSGLECSSKHGQTAEMNCFEKPLPRCDLQELIVVGERLETKTTSFAIQPDGTLLESTSGDFSRPGLPIWRNTDRTSEGVASLFEASDTQVKLTEYVEAACAKATSFADTNALQRCRVVSNNNCTIENRIRVTKRLLLDELELTICTIYSYARSQAH